MNVKDMSTDDIETRIGEIIGDMANIRAQIGEAKGRAAVNGEYSDSGWFHRANLALRLKGRDHQSLQVELGKRRREEKKAHSDTVEQAFIDVARSRLDYTTFRALMDEATALVGQRKAA